MSASLHGHAQHELIEKCWFKDPKEHTARVNIDGDSRAYVMAAFAPCNETQCPEPTPAGYDKDMVPVNIDHDPFPTGYWPDPPHPGPEFESKQYGTLYFTYRDFDRKQSGIYQMTEDNFEKLVIEDMLNDGSWKAFEFARDIGLAKAVADRYNNRK